MTPLAVVEDPQLSSNGVYFQHECMSCGFFQVLDFGDARREHLCNRDGVLVHVEWQEAA